jgi:6-phosphogluconate dehydrogenase
MLAFLFAEHSSTVSLFDISSEHVFAAQNLLSNSPSHADKVRTFDQHSLRSFISSLGSDENPRLFVLSVPHGVLADHAIDSLKQHLRKGDIILDGGNEHYRETERRQREMEKIGVRLIGCGVSGGYQSARHGPSLSPGGDHKTLEKILPQLREWAAKDQHGNPCVTAVGPRGSGQFHQFPTFLELIES